MSELRVEIKRIDRVTSHPNADRLCLAQIGGWQSVIGKNEDGSPVFGEGDHVVYIPIDAVLNRELADRIGVTKYLSEKTDAVGNRVLVVRRAKLRGEPSFGICLKPESPQWKLGEDVTAHFGIQKYLPPIKTTASDAEPDHPLFQSYTDIENMRNFPDVFADGEEVIVTEKIHGTNCRIGIIDGEWMAGSNNIRRKRPDDETMGKNTYWYPYTIPGVRTLLEGFGQHKQIILFGEVFGSSVQSLHYGHKGRIGFRAFDLLLDGRYLNWGIFATLAATNDVEVVPVLARIPYSLESVKAFSDGKTTLADNHIREGVVVKPVAERTDPRIGRVVLKYIGDGYLLDEKISDSTDV